MDVVPPGKPTSCQAASGDEAVEKARMVEAKLARAAAGEDGERRLAAAGISELSRMMVVE